MSETKTVIPLNLCESSNIRGWGYAEETKQLAVQFRGSGATYIYPNVPPEVAKGFEETESVGRYFASEIRGVFDGVKQEAEPAEPDSLGG